MVLRIDKTTWRRSKSLHEAIHCLKTRRPCRSCSKSPSSLNKVGCKGNWYLQHKKYLRSFLVAERKSWKRFTFENFDGEVSGCWIQVAKTIRRQFLLEQSSPQYWKLSGWMRATCEKVKMSWIAKLQHGFNTVAKKTSGCWWTSLSHGSWLGLALIKSFCALSPQHPSRQRKFLQVEICNGVSVLDDGWLHVIFIFSFYLSLRRYLSYDIIWYHMMSYDVRWCQVMSGDAIACWSTTDYTYVSCTNLHNFACQRVAGRAVRHNTFLWQPFVLKWPSGRPTRQNRH